MKEGNTMRRLSVTVLFFEFVFPAVKVLSSLVYFFSIELFRRDKTFLRHVHRYHRCGVVVITAA